VRRRGNRCRPISEKTFAIRKVEGRRGESLYPMTKEKSQKEFSFYVRKEGGGEKLQLPTNLRGSLLARVKGGSSLTKLPSLGKKKEGPYPLSLEEKAVKKERTYFSEVPPPYFPKYPLRRKCIGRKGRFQPRGCLLLTGGT